MIWLIIAASVAIINISAIPSSVKTDCAKISVFMATVKQLQMSGKTEDAIIDELGTRGYGVEEEKQQKLVRALIQMSAEDLSTPELVKSREEKECLQEYAIRNNIK